MTVVPAVVRMSSTQEIRLCIPSSSLPRHINPAAAAQTPSAVKTLAIIRGSSLVAALCLPIINKIGAQFAERRRSESCTAARGGGFAFLDAPIHRTQLWFAGFSLVFENFARELLLGSMWLVGDAK